MNNDGFVDNVQVPEGSPGNRYASSPGYDLIVIGLVVVPEDMGATAGAYLWPVYF